MVCRGRVVALCAERLVTPEQSPSKRNVTDVVGRGDW